MLARVANRITKNVSAICYCKFNFVPSRGVKSLYEEDFFGTSITDSTSRPQLVPGWLSILLLLLFSLSHTLSLSH